MSRTRRNNRYPDKTYYTVAGWMKRLGLDRTVRDIFAWVWSFSIKGNWNLASVREYAEYLAMSEQAAREGLRKLIAMGLIIREVYSGDYGVAFRHIVPAEVVTAIRQHVAAGDEWDKTALPLNAEFTPTAIIPHNADKRSTDVTSTPIESLPLNHDVPINIEDKTVNKKLYNNKKEEGAGADAPALMDTDVQTLDEQHESAQTSTKNKPDAIGAKERKNGAKKKEKVNLSMAVVTADKNESVSPDYLKFLDWINTHAVEVSQMRQPFTEEQYREIQQNYDPYEVADVLEAMSNTVNLTKKYVSAYKTCKSWLRQRKERRGNGKPAGGPAKSKINTENRLNANDEWER